MKKSSYFLALCSLFLVSCSLRPSATSATESGHQESVSSEGKSMSSSEGGASISSGEESSVSSEAESSSEEESGVSSKSEEVPDSYSSLETSSKESSAAQEANLNAVPEEERICLSWEGTGSFKVSYKKSEDSEYTYIDPELVSENEAHILGLKEGTYDVRVEAVHTDGTTFVYASESGIPVQGTDRSGYAFFNRTEGVGAYNLDGTLKKDAIVLYVDDSNKNTVTCNGTKGLIKILQKSKSFKKPLDIRLLSSIETNQFQKKDSSAFSTSHTVYDYGGTSYFTNTKETTYTDLDGLTNWVKGPSSLEIKSSEYTYKGVTKAGDTDSYFNMADIEGAENVTIEGVGKNVTIHQWGFTWKKCSSIEVKNLVFADYPEDACSFQGGSNDDMDYGNCFVHRCTFQRGKNNWDCTSEQDKHDGDGSIDLKFLSSFTAAYNHFRKDHKTGLIGGSDKHYTKCVTFHHNFYDQCSSRLPLGRKVNLHAYNNYYLGCGNCQDMRANSYTLSENNLFESCTYPQKVTSGAIIKSVGDSYVSCKNASQAKASARTDILSNACKPDGNTDYSKFDTDPKLFYYDSVQKKSGVALLEPASDLKTLKSRAGVFAE